jgi:hypothetical protein
MRLSLNKGLGGGRLQVGLLVFLKLTYLQQEVN